VRERARYESTNNAYARGIVRTQANDVVGTGPRLQLLTEDQALNTRIEAEFGRWAAAIGLAAKLRQMQQAKVVDGEAFGQLISNARVGHPVVLDLQPIEADQIASPVGARLAEREVDGIQFDEAWNPVTYTMLDGHPGEDCTALPTTRPVPAEQMLHLYRADRAGQRRGLSEIAPSLPLFAQLRRYTIAVLTAAETAARFAGVLQTDAPPDGADEIDPLDAIDLEPNMLLTLPAGWKMGQVQAEQPTTSYGQFKAELINEIARPLNMPYNVAAGNSASYNYASGRLDHQTYHKAIDIERQDIEQAVLDRILRAWLAEARIALNLDGVGADSMLVPHAWFWPGREHVDPAKEANAQATRLASSTTTLAAEFARQGLDWEAALRQRAKEIALMRELGLPVLVGVDEEEDADEEEVSDAAE